MDDGIKIGKTEILGICVGFLIAFFIVSSQFSKRSEEPSCNGIYMVGNYASCSWPWGGIYSEYWYKDNDAGFIGNKLWVGSSYDVERLNNNGIFRTEEDAKNNKFWKQGEAWKPEPQWEKP